MSFFGELKRRNVFRVAAAYGVSAWLLIEVGSLMFDAFDFPDWTAQLLIMLLALGFVPVVIFAWAYELTPEGLKRDRGVEHSESFNRMTGRRLDQVTIAMILIALAIVMLDQFVLDALDRNRTGESAVVEKAPVTVDPAPEVAAPEDDEAVFSPDPNSVAVLPFVNMSADPENEYFADGISEEILNVLARVEGLKVASRTSAFAFKGAGAGVGEIARELGVAHVLEGSVRKQGDQVRVTAQLIQAKDGFHLWSDAYDRRLTDIFAIQDEIARAILDELVAQLTDQPLPSTAERLTDDPEAYELFLQGRHFWRMRNPSALRRAVELFDQAVAIDPGFDRAWSALAIAWQNRDEYDPTVDSDRALRNSREAADRALALNAANGEALVAKAEIMARECRYLEADGLYRQAVAADPNDPTVHHWYTLLLEGLGMLEQGKAEIARALELDALNTAIIANMSEVAEFDGNIERALELARRAAELGFQGGTRVPEGLILARAGRLEEAEPLLRDDVAQLSDVDPAWVDAFLATLRDPKHLPELERLLGESEDFFMVPDILAFFGSRRSLDFIASCHILPSQYAWHPKAAPLRSTPEFFDAMEAVGVVDFWRERGWPDLCHELDPEQAECDAL